jgi:uncharacterized protein DUF6599
MLPRAVAKRSEGRGESEERIFVRDGLRSFRRSYRVAEVYWGLGTGAVLLGILGWVGWKGAHPDPTLFDMSAALSGSSPAQLPAAAPAERRAGERMGAPRARGGGGEASPAAAPEPTSETTGVTNDRGPLPAGLASDAFREGKLSAYTSDNLYIKIDGRASYFQSFGVKTMHTVTLEGSPEGAGTSVDVEVYDLGESRNAIGAYNGERPPGLESTVADGSTYHYDRNAAFLARGPYYVRVIGSDESPEVVAEVRRLIELFRREIHGEALPWGFALFVDQLKVAPSAVTYVKSNAFSFGFARDVYKATLSPPDAKDDMEAFVVATADAQAARALEKQYAEGFSSLGAAAGTTRAHARLFKDEYLATYSAVMPVERWLVGVRGAASGAQAAEVLASLEHGLAALPAEVRARAVPSSGLDAPEGEPGGAGGPEPPSSPEPGAAEAAGAVAPQEPEKNAHPEASPGKPAEEESHEL